MPRTAPTAPKLALHLTRITALQQPFTADKEAAQKRLNLGESKRNEKIVPLEHAAWTGLCSLVLNLDEAISKE